VFCEAGGIGRGGKGDKEKSPGDLLNEFARRGKEAMDGMEPGFSSRFQSLLPENFLQDAGRKTHEILQNGVPGQIGYGFLMGYSSGFCLKKVSKLVAFAVGGFFIVIQTLSFNGYMQVNYEKLEKEANKVLDVNHDGKVDAKDAEAAYYKLQSVLSYHMPTGGGFASGLIMGLRS
jgi:uncharacterized membrane protein (Fun14 family)